jgi:hypothetical protein
MHKKTRVQSAKKVKQLQEEKNKQLEVVSSEKSKIKVYARLRPLLKKELEINNKNCIKVVDPSTVYVLDYNEISGGVAKKGTYFSFNGAFEESTTNEALYNETIKNSITGVVEGLGNSCVMAYGTTNAGKTYTTFGESDKNAGIIPRALNEFVLLKESKSLSKIKLSAYFVEIYNETLKDLFEPTNNNKLMVREDPNRGSIIQGVKEVEILNIKDIYKLILKGNSNRATDSTSDNANSSRSHAILVIQVENSNTNSNTGFLEPVYSKYAFCDLAGAEKSIVGSDNKSSSKLNIESKNINRSLLYLGKCIHYLADTSNKKSGNNFIPWRESILTR